MNTVVLRLFDPGATQYEPLSFDDVRADLVMRHPCGVTPAAEATMRALKIFNRNIEIVPETTSTFWVPFKPATLAVEGNWRLAAYEIPSVVDEAGRPTRTTRFEIRLVAKSVQVTLNPDGTTTSSSPAGGPPASAPGGGSLATGGGSSQTAPATGASAAPSANVAPSNSASATAPAAAGGRVSRETIARAQAKLNEMGFGAGAADGAIGPRSRDAIRKFQASRKLNPTGELDSATLAALGVN